MVKQLHAKFVLNCLYKMKASIEANNNEFFLPNFNCFSPDQLKYIEKYLKQEQCISLAKKGGIWNDEGKFFLKNVFKADWSKIDHLYKEVLHYVPYINYEKQFKGTRIQTKERTKSKLRLSDLKISAHINKSAEGLTPEQIEEVLMLRYPIVRRMQQELEEINKRLVVPNKLEFHLTFSKDALEKVGLRMTNSMVSLKKKDGSRAKFLEEHGLHSNPNGDIKSEIPRVTCLLNTREWKPFSFDFYSQFLGKEKVPDLVRGFVKENFMPLYFTSWSSAQAFSNRQYLGLDSKYKGEAEHQTRLILEKMKQGFDQLCIGESGETFKSEIFLYTSYLELQALKILVARYPEAKFFQVYDEIFSDVDIPDMEDVYAEAASRLLAASPNFKEELSNLKAALNAGTPAVAEDYYELTNKLRNREVVDVCVFTLVSKNGNLTSSSSSKFGNADQPAETRNFYGLEDARLKSHKNRNLGGYSLSEETKQKMSKPKSEETKQKMSKPKSEETKQKISATASQALNQEIVFARGLMQSENYSTITKKRARQQFIDQKLVEHFGQLSSWTLTKIRKLANIR